MQFRIDMGYFFNLNVDALVCNIENTQFWYNIDECNQSTEHINSYNNVVYG